MERLATWGRSFLALVLAGAGVGVFAGAARGAVEVASHGTEIGLDYRTLEGALAGIFVGIFLAVKSLGHPWSFVSEVSLGSLQASDARPDEQQAAQENQPALDPAL